MEKLIQNQIAYFNWFINDSIQETFLKPPVHSPEFHYIELSENKYFLVLVALRQIIKLISDDFFCNREKAICLDLFMFTSSISSPMGPGSDSEAIPFKFGNLDSFLVDSSQFGFEPLLLNGVTKAYSYLPSMRGENPDERHLNQFYHCEAEIIGPLPSIIELVENYIKALSEGLLLCSSILKKICKNYDITKNCLAQILQLNNFPQIDFDDAVKILKDVNQSGLITNSDNGNDITSLGESKLAEIMNISTPFWLINFDRDRVPFYQKPNPENTSKVLCADLIAPSLFKGSFDGEILGAGQRQDNAKEMYESLRRQNLSPTPYEWYIKLRELPSYKTTSGFGMGIERYISWIVGLDNIRDAILYPRLKNVPTFP